MANEDAQETRNFCELVERLRIATDISQRVFAAMCGVSRIAYIKWITGERTPRPRNLEQLRRVTTAVNRARKAGELPLRNGAGSYATRAREIIAIVNNYKS